jgi:tetratricopeptide (TPR) repeat protein
MEEEELYAQARAFHLRALALDSIADYTRAILLYNEAIQRNPAEVAYYGCRGDACTERARLALRNNPQQVHEEDWKRIVCGLGLLMYRADYRQAIADFTRVLEAEPERVPTLYLRGECYRAMGKFDQAIADFMRGIELAPERDDCYFGHAMTHLTAFCGWAQSDLRQAQADFSRAIALNPDILSYKTYAGMVEEGIDLLNMSSRTDLEDHEKGRGRTIIDRLIDLQIPPEGRPGEYYAIDGESLYHRETCWRLGGRRKVRLRLALAHKFYDPCRDCLKDRWRARSKGTTGRRTTGQAPNADCFVVTAVFGTPDDQTVRTLRIFRESVLRRSRTGRRAIAVYNAAGPRAARLVWKYPSLRRVLAPCLHALAQWLAGRRQIS